LITLLGSHAHGRGAAAGLPSALKSLATLTQAELQMLTDVGLNPFGNNAPLDTALLGTSLRMRGGALPLQTPVSMDMTEVVSWLMQNPLPTPTPGSVSENIKLWDSKCPSPPLLGCDTRVSGRVQHGPAVF
jgi:hypothetical protein